MRKGPDGGAGAAAVRLLPLLALYIAFTLVATGPLALVKDEPTYLHLAENLTRGGYVDEGTENPLRSVWFGPGLPLMLVTRPEFGLVLEAALAACAIWWLARRGHAAPRRLTAVCAVALVACVPWLVYTHSVTDRTLVWLLAGGLSLYWMASPYPEDLGDWHAFGDPFATPDRPLHREVFGSLDELPVPERDVRLQEVARERIGERPQLYARNVALNFGRLWAGMPYTGKGFQPQKVLFAIPNGLLLLAFGVAAVRLWRRRRGLPGEVFPVILIGLAYLAVHLTVSTEPSHLTPFVPIAVWAVAVAVVTGGVTLRGWQRLQERGRSLP